MALSNSRYTCDLCRNKPCRKGDRGSFPPNCPGRDLGEEQALALYPEDALKMMRAAAFVEAAGYGKWSRTEEIMAFCRQCNYSNIGIAFCAGLSEEAAIAAKILRSNGFTVNSVCCKNCSVPKERAGIPPEDTVSRGKEYEAMCNPIGQAVFLERAGCQLALILGLCVGHDSAFIRRFPGPVTVLSAKDRATGNNPLASIYTADSYYKRQYFFLKENEKLLRQNKQQE